MANVSVSGVACAITVRRGMTESSLVLASEVSGGCCC